MEARVRYIYKYVILCGWLVISGYSLGAMPALQPTDSTLLPSSGERVKKSIYPKDQRTKSKIYNWLWGEHYRKLYTVPVTVPVLRMNTFMGGLDILRQVPDFHGLLVQNPQNQYFLLRPLGGATSFLGSDFFQEMYNKKDFKNTYMDEFIADSYTMINPYTFIVADHLAKASGLISIDSKIYFIPKNSTRDTVADGTMIQDKLVTVIDIPNLDRSNIHTTKELLEQIRTSKGHEVDQNAYIRERLLDILIGDWNKIPENWTWRSSGQEDSVVYEPIVIDRNHAFTKVDGMMFKQMLNVLTLGFIVNYDSTLTKKNLKKVNSLGFPLDMAVTSQSDQSPWLSEARFLRQTLTDAVIDQSFRLLPEDIQSTETNLIRAKLKYRRDTLEHIARQYYKQLQRTPVLTGTDRNDRIVVKRYGRDSLQIMIYDDRNQPVFDRRYSEKETKQIWLYALNGNDTFEVEGKAKKEIPVYLISGKGENTYDIESGKNIRIYGYESEKEKLDTIPHVKKILSDDETIHAYDYEKIKYHTTSFTPWGIYDTDRGITLGAFFTYTEYGFKRAPFTYRHRIGYNYLEGLMYQGIFPSYDGRKNFHLDAFVGSPWNFSNFFGFGNATPGYKDEKRKYNRVTIHQYDLRPSLHLSLKKDQKLILYTGLNLYKVKRSNGRFISLFYPADSRIFKMNYFVDLGATYEIDKSFGRLLPNVTGSLSAGWVMNLKDAGRNFPYTEASLSWDMPFTDRFTWASLVKGRVLYNDKYEFYQSATIDLRGFRDNRFIGKQSFYQYSDFRFDMGTFKNSFIPLKYGLFAGFDYGRVWYPTEHSRRWHTSYGGGFWLTVMNKITTKYSFFGSTDTFRFMFELGMGF